MTPLHIAAMRATSSNYKCLDHLVRLAKRNESDIDIPDIVRVERGVEIQMGRSPLFYAASYCNVFSVKFLLANGASVRLRDYSGLVLLWSLTFRTDALQYAKGSPVGNNKEKKRQKEEILRMLCEAQKKEESPYCKQMNGLIAQIRSEIRIPATARELSGDAISF